MVYILDREGALCEQIDSAVSSAQTGLSDESARKDYCAFLHESLRAMTEALPPSVLLDAVLMYVFLKLHLAASSGEGEGEGEIATRDTKLSASQDPIKDQMTSYTNTHSSDENNIHKDDAKPFLDSEKHSFVAAAAFAASDVAGFRALLAARRRFLDELSPDRLAASHGSAASLQGVWEALRRLVPNSNTTHINKNDTTEKAAEEEEEEGVLDATSRLQKVLFHTPGLVADLASLWGLKYFTRWFCWWTWWQSCQLGAENGEGWCEEKLPAAGVRGLTGAFLRDCGALPAEDFVHDYDLILPLSLISWTNWGYEQLGQRLAVSTMNNRKNMNDSKIAPRGWEVLICPLLSTTVTNPARMQKNARVDHIQRALAQLQFERLTGLRATTSASTAAGKSQACSSAASLRRAFANETQATLALQERLCVRLRLSHTLAQINNHSNKLTKNKTNMTAEALPHRRLPSITGLAEARESMAAFTRTALIGLDMKLMALAAGAAGFAFARLILRASSATAWIMAGAAFITMLFVDTLLLLFQIARKDGDGERRRVGNRRRPKRVAITTAAHAAAGAPQAASSPTIMSKKQQ